ncbi:MAG: hypothetical protein ACRD2L_09375 [Terriglobia bacterium]
MVKTIMALEAERWSARGGKSPFYSFVRPYSDKPSLEAIRHFMKVVQKRIPSRRLVRGLACIERTWKNAHFEGVLHLHALLWGVNHCYENPAEFITQLATKAALTLIDTKGRRMASEATLDIQVVSEPEGIIDYLTKDLNRTNMQRKTRVLLIEKTGICMDLD